MKSIDINEEELNSIFAVIGLSNQEGIKNRTRMRKYRQVFDFLIHIEKAVCSLSTKRPLSIVDCACGRSYLSFIANYYFLNVLNKKIDFTCIDYNKHVIDKSKYVAESLGFDNMNFICDDIFNTQLKKEPDIVYSLHACNTATDMTIAKGISEQAKYIMTVSCCQHFVRYRMKKHPLTSITRHGAYKERIADMLSDSMRSLILEEAGYQINLFEYVPSSETPKNIMVRAMKGSYSEKRSQYAREEWNKLQEIFHVEPKLIEYINHARQIKEMKENH